MFWQESRKDEVAPACDEVTDIAYQIRCRTLPVDHAWALSEAVQKVLPWIGSETGAGVHTIHVAESGNGWMRPEGADDLLYLSRRTKLQIRVPQQRVADAEQLVGKTLDVAGHELTVEKATLKPLTPFAAVFSRYVESSNTQDENAFLAAMVRELGEMDIRPLKMLCGIEKTLGTPAGPVRTRSLMIADLTLPESLRLLQRGLGPRRALGCGLFLPHKDIKELSPAQER
jgi:CRISPR-associated protein Cas6